MSKRPLNPVKDEDAQTELVKRQVPANYALTSAQSAIASLNPFLQPTQPAPTRPKIIPHNGLSAAEQLLNSRKQAQDIRDQKFLDTDKVGSLIRTCPNEACSSAGSAQHVIRDERVGSFICTACGTDAGTIIIEGADWRTFEDSGTQNNRVTSEGKFGLEYALQNNGDKKSPDQRRLAKVSAALDTYRNILRFEDYIYKTARDMAGSYLLAPADLIGKNIIIETLAAVCLYEASRHHHKPYTIQDLVTITSVTEKAFNKQLTRFQKAKRFAEQSKHTTTVIDPSQEVIDFIGVYCGKLGLAQRYIDVASSTIHTATQLHTKLLSSKSTSVAAAAILFVTTLDSKQLNKHELARISSTSLTTIRDHAKTLHDLRDKVVPGNFVSPDRLKQIGRDEL